MNKDRVVTIFGYITDLAFLLLVAAVTFSNALTEITTAVIIGAFIIKRFMNRDLHIPQPRLTLILFGLIFFCALSFINTSYMNESIRGILKVIKHTTLFMATIDHFSSKRRVTGIILFMIGVGFFSSLNGIVQSVISTDLIRGRTIDPFDHLRRISSSFQHANDFGGYLVVIISLLLSLIFSRSRRFKERVLSWVVFLPVAWCLKATSSRGAWLGAIIALLYLTFAKSKRLFVCILIMLAVSIPFLPHGVKERFSDFTTVSQKGGTVWERLELWKGTINMIKARPILGFGINTYTKNFPAYKPPDYPDVRYTHNSYLHMASEIGIPGASIFILFMLMFVVFASKAVRGFASGIDRDLFIGLVAGIIGFLAHSAVDTHLYSVTLSAFLFACLGMAVVFMKISHEKKA